MNNKYIHYKYKYTTNTSTAAKFGCQAGYTAVVAHLEVGVRPICAFPKAWAHKDAGEQVPCRMYPDRDCQSLIPIYDRDRCNPIITTTLARSHRALTHTHANARIDAQARPSECALRKRFEFACAFVRLPSHSHMRSVRSLHTPICAHAMFMLCEAGLLFLCTSVMTDTSCPSHATGETCPLPRTHQIGILLPEVITCAAHANK